MDLIELNDAAAALCPTCSRFKPTVMALSGDEVIAKHDHCRQSLAHPWPPPQARPRFEEA